VSTRLIRFFSFFTVESNVLVVIVAATLAVRPARDGRVWRVLRLQSLFGITVTGIVYATLLRGVVDLHGAAAVTNALLLRRAVDDRSRVGAVRAAPASRRAHPRGVVGVAGSLHRYTFAHGAVTDWYPYPFVDVTVLGYVTMLRNGVGLIVLLLGVGSVFRWLDQHLPHSTDARAGAECQLEGPSREELAGSTRTTPRKP